MRLEDRSSAVGYKALKCKFKGRGPTACLSQTMCGPGGLGEGGGGGGLGVGVGEGVGPGVGDGVGEGTGDGCEMPWVAAVGLIAFP
jgi:hypothetical protein